MRCDHDSPSIILSLYRIYFDEIVNTHIGLFLLILLLPSLVLAADAEEKFFRIERSKQTDMGLRITSIGGFGLQGRKVGHLDLSYIESVSDGDGLALDLGGGVSFHAGVTFFLGVGFLLGYNWDNSDFIGAYYPEAGVFAQITKTFGVVVTGKRYFNLYNNTEDENVVMFGLLFGGR